MSVMMKSQITEIQLFIQVNNKNTKLDKTGPLLGGPLTKGHLCDRRFHAMT